MHPKRAAEAEVLSIVDAVRWVLRGHSAAVQGAALADCLAIWLAGHHVAGDENATRKIRDKLLGDWLLTVEQLVPVNAKIIGTTP